MTDKGDPNSLRTVATRAMVQASVLALVVLFCIISWLAFEFLLLIFASILFGVLFNGVAQWVTDKTGMPYSISLLLFFVVLIIVLGAAVILLAPSISAQFESLADNLPRAIEQWRARAEDSTWMKFVLEQRERLEQAVEQSTGIFSVVTGVLSSITGAFSSFAIAFILGICLSISPGSYVGGFLKLIPRGYRPRAKQVLLETGSTLQSWLIAKLLEMLVIGVFTTIGLWLIGIELALVLGLIAGLLSFIPNIGPILAIIPAILLASLEGTETVLWVIALYMGIQAIESWGLTPWLQHRIVEMPPALTISIQILFGLLAGTIGLILATPLAAAGMVLINMLYVQDMLGDHAEDQGID
ncbi:AI-2E family transporter [Pseudomonas sp. OIL-1]|uniref:AI-2E family transporter n=1 Tax=Pseudomonas sp. OIL-1 TaxID=2706126 RepID=UPI0013A71E44|nr:AI-2E family transporter [Pseudomonas sp. OIL-1]QIB52374.1 AI-2E family transporter [Pseudomonas sp. OIL-1]